jgi:hypothetical protein
MQKDAVDDLLARIRINESSSFLENSVMMFNNLPTDRTIKKSKKAMANINRISVVA